jgi:hypothetical protein
MNRIRLIAGAVLVLAALSAPSVVSADPANSLRAEVFTLDCDKLGEVEIAVNGNGDWTPGHVIGTNQILIPVAFDITGTFTPAGGGAPEVFHDQQSRKAPKNKQLQDCTFHDEGSDESGSFVIDGTVTLYVVGH